MASARHPAFGPDTLTRLYGAFDAAWDSVKQSASDRNRDAAREAVGKAIIGLASAGDLDPTHLANYAAYQARQFIDLRG